MIQLMWNRNKRKKELVCLHPGNDIVLKNRLILHKNDINNNEILDTSTREFLGWLHEVPGMKF